MITLFPEEVAELQKQNRNHRLVKTVGRHYYMCDDDWLALQIVAEMRGYDTNTFYRTCVKSLHYR